MVKSHEPTPTLFFIGGRLGPAFACTQRLSEDAALVGAPYAEIATPEVALAFKAPPLLGWEVVVGLIPGGGIARYSLQPLGTWASQFNGTLDIDWTVSQPGALVARNALRLPLSQIEMTARGWLNGLANFSQAILDSRADEARTESIKYLEGTVEAAAGLVDVAPRRPGRRGHPDAMIANVARVYAEAVSRGAPHVVKDIAAANNVAPATVQGYLNTARSRGFLTRAPKGVQGGELTPLGRSKLDQPER